MIISALLTERYKERLLGVLSLYDRVIITGTLPGACYSQRMTSCLYAQKIKIFDYDKAFADPLRHRIRENVQNLAKAQGLEIEQVGNANLRKEDRVAKVLARRGEHPGLVHILSAMERCSAYKPWHDGKRWCL